MTYDEMVKKLGYSTCTRSGNDPTMTGKNPKPMDFANAKIVVGNRVYPTNYVNYVSTPGEYPAIEANATLDLLQPFPTIRIQTPYILRT